MDKAIKDAAARGFPQAYIEKYLRNFFPDEVHRGRTSGKLHVAFFLM